MLGYRENTQVVRLWIAGFSITLRPGYCNIRNEDLFNLLVERNYIVAYSGVEGAEYSEDADQPGYPTTGYIGGNI